MSRYMLQYACQVLLKKGDDHDLSGSTGKRKKDHSQRPGMSGVQRARLREYPVRSGIQGAWTWCAENIRKGSSVT